MMFSKKESDSESLLLVNNEEVPLNENNLTPWKMLIVDDEPDIHKVTEMVLDGVTFDDREIQFLNAYSGKEAKEVLAANDDIALVLLDVVMETNQAGLEVASFIRQELNNQLVRIVLRTGQPGEAPEERVFIEYDINDYKEKTELDRKRLFTTVYSAIRAYRDLIHIDKSRIYLERNRIGLEKVILASARLFKTHSLDKFISGLLEQIASILFIDNDSMIFKIGGVSAHGENASNWEIVNTNGQLDNADPVKMQEINEYLQLACSQQKSLFKDDVFIGYFETKSGKVTLIYLEGCKDLDPLGKQLLDVFSLNITIAFENIMLEKEVTDTQSEVILRLGEVLETRSRETGNHVRRLALLSQLVAKHLGLSEAECNEILNASPMHDIGKIAISDAILLKPGRFSDEEFDKMKYHAEAGYLMLSSSNRPLMKSAALIAWQHHEHFDGNGYPQGLKGEDIHLYARIVAIVDVFDALMHKRCYKEPWTLDQTIEVLKNGKGGQFDPKIIDTFLSIIPLAIDIINQFPDSKD